MRSSPQSEPGVRRNADSQEAFPLRAGRRLKAGQFGPGLDRLGCVVDECQVAAGDRKDAVDVVGVGRVECFAPCLRVEVLAELVIALRNALRWAPSRSSFEFMRSSSAVCPAGFSLVIVRWRAAR